MINKQSIYYWFFFPLLALLSAGSLTSCIYDSVLEETDMSGKSTLSITMRGITTTDPSTSGGSYDDYVKTLRVIGYDNAGNVVCNQKYSGTDLGTVEGTAPNTYIEITQTLEDTFQGGVCDFYFIANEEEYFVYNSQTTTKQKLSAFLGDNAKNAPPKVDLSSCIIAFDAESGLTPGYPILMTVHSTSQFLKPGNNEMGSIQLVRCVAKVQLIVQKDNTDKYRIPENDVVTISDVSLHGTRPDSYSLWDTKSHFATNSVYTHNFTTIANDNVGYGTDGSSAYTSDMVYFPETLSPNNTTEGVLYFTFTLNYKPNGANTPTVRTYTVAIGEDADKDGTVDDYNIYRNTVYTVTATLQWQPTTPELNIQVDAWNEVEVDVPAFE